jgi:sec-independent protein translocase protein TatA
MPLRLGPLELVIILAIIIAIFGAGKLASLGGALGKGVKDFRASMKDEDTEKKDEDQTGTDPKA